MAWLLHPDDYTELHQRSRKWIPDAAMPLGSVVVFRCFCLERGHIQDTEHAELGAPTFAEYGARHAWIMEAERRRFQRSLATLEKYMTPMPALPFPYGPRRDILDTDSEAS